MPSRQADHARGNSGPDSGSDAVSANDARARLGDIIQQLFREPHCVHLAGGVGLYPATAAHGPFVHVDARGYAAKW